MYSINYRVNNKITSKLHKFIIFSLVIHVIMIIGFTIRWYTNINYSTKAIDITLVSEKSISKPKLTDFLAQNNQFAGGDQDKKNNPTVNQKALFPNEVDKEVNLTNQTETIINDLDKKIKKKSNFITSKHNNNSTFTNKDVNNSKEDFFENMNFVFQIENTPEITSLIKNIEHRKKLYAMRPKIRYVTAATEEFRDAVYLDQWRRKIELYGNKYYPEQAKMRNLSGKVILLVSINANGLLNKVKIEKSSGIKILDDAAVQTIHLAAPFEPFTKEMRKDTDVLEIIRTWSFNESEDGQALVVSTD